MIQIVLKNRYRLDKKEVPVLVELGWIVRITIRDQIQHIIPQSATSFAVAIGCGISSKHYHENIAVLFLYS